MGISNKSKGLSYNRFLDDLGEDVMGFLNEVQLNFPNATSLASGRPDASFFDLEDIQEYVDIFVNHLSTLEKKDTEQILKTLGQYNRTKGIINDLVCKYLEKDCGIKVNANNTIISVGTQEGLALTVMTLCNREEDVLLVEDPSYVGISHFSILAGYKIAPVKMGENGLCLDTLEEKVKVYQKKGKVVKLVYVIPDFQNPTGSRMSIKNRIRLLELSDTYGFMIIEDNAYGDFIFEGAKYPTLKSLDRNKNVIYLHSFSKVLHPSLRIGLLVSDKSLKGKKKLSHLVAKLKGYTTVNTPSLTQSVLGGMLIKHNFSFQSYNKTKIENLKAKKELVIAALEECFGRAKDEFLNKFSWNNPKGGYFLTLICPMNITKDDVLNCARHHNVIFTPMSFFYLGKGGENVIRLAYSHVKEDNITKAIENLATFLSKKSSEKASDKAILQLEG